MNGADKLIEIIGKGSSFYTDAALIGGSGAGQPLGLLNSACKIEVAREVGQSANTIVLENINAMVARLYQGGWKNAVWLASQTLLPQLLQLSLSVGTGGSASLIMTEQDGIYKIYGKEILFTEQGTDDDIVVDRPVTCEWISPRGLGYE